MNTFYSPSDILWIKNVTSNEYGQAYMDLTDDSFVLHFPTRHKGNVRRPKIDDIILIHQNINKVKVFTHLVTPTDNKLLDENIRSKYRYGRQVKIIAKTDVKNAIPVSKTLWRRVNFQGISQGNACEIQNIKEISNIEELQLDIWQRFSNYFAHNEKESATTTNAALSDITTFSPDITVTEGESRLDSHIAKERNQEIVKQKKMYAIENSASKCEVCEFSFLEAYNATYIECHHLTPIGQGV